MSVNLIIFVQCYVVIEKKGEGMTMTNVTNVCQLSLHI
jgi:hypothetical protein